MPGEDGLPPTLKNRAAIADRKRKTPRAEQQTASFGTAGVTGIDQGHIRLPGTDRRDCCARILHPDSTLAQGVVEIQALQIGVRVPAQRTDRFGQGDAPVSLGEVGRPTDRHISGGSADRGQAIFGQGHLLVPLDQFRGQKAFQLVRIGGQEDVSRRSGQELVGQFVRGTINGPDADAGCLEGEVGQELADDFFQANGRGNVQGG